MNVCYTAGCAVVIVFDCMKIFKFSKSVNGILLPIIHTIDMHHHKLDKSFLNFFAGP